MAHKTERLVSRDKFVNAASFREQEITIENVGIVRIRELSVAQRVRYMEYIEIGEDKKPHMDTKKQVEFDRLIVSMGLLNGDVTRNGEGGDLMFPDPADIPDTLNFEVLDIIANGILRISGMVKDVEAKDKPKNLLQKRTISDDLSASSSV